VVLEHDGRPLSLDNDVVFSMIGREAPLEFFRRSGIRIAGEWTPGRIAGLAAFLAFCFALYNWKSGGFLEHWHRAWGGFPFDLADRLAAAEPGSLLDVLRISASGPAFYYTLAYSALVAIFGVRRIRRRRTPYVTVQTVTLIAVQVVPLFLLPEILLPWLDARGWLPRWLADPLFPAVDYGHGREFWRAYGLILAWPLNVYNVFTDSPNFAWLVICFLQTFVAIPAMIYFWGKGAYCGWICSCGALAETLGDTHRHKMPHGPRFNRLNLAGQLILAVAFVLLALRILSWTFPEADALRRFNSMALWQSNLGWKWVVDVLLAGIVGYGVYFWYSGRVWCRFFCPLAALMHLYARFSRFRILADKKKCISCNVCTSVCHQGIDVMNFANKGLPMGDPECVRCSACVGACPTGVLTFGQVGRDGRVLGTDRLAASAVRLSER
ncbi:MAG TPA: 4Fe-4S binding protein, partial [Candidatus Polarisedimenticolaceae bacterium]|nr:4Fe-4S binding protein [Candidatus Polarisedimenticolaceae bacterium]